MTRETVRVLYHLNGMTKLALEEAHSSTRFVLDVPTERIPEALRHIGTLCVAELVGDEVQRVAYSV